MDRYNAVVILLEMAKEYRCLMDGMGIGLSQDEEQAITEIASYVAKWEKDDEA